jgi:hypothetical protein
MESSDEDLDRLTFMHLALQSRSVSGGLIEKSAADDLSCSVT